MPHPSEISLKDCGLFCLLYANNGVHANLMIVGTANISGVGFFNELIRISETALSTPLLAYPCVGHAKGRCQQLFGEMLLFTTKPKNYFIFGNDFGKLANIFHSNNFGLENAFEAC